MEKERKIENNEIPNGLLIVLKIIKLKTIGEIDEDNEHKPCIFLMALRIFLMHSSQCKKTFSSTTYGQKTTPIRTKKSNSKNFLSQKHLH